MRTRHYDSVTIHKSFTIIRRLVILSDMRNIEWGLVGIDIIILFSCPSFPSINSDVTYDLTKTLFLLIVPPLLTSQAMPTFLTTAKTLMGDSVARMPLFSLWKSWRLLATLGDSSTKENPTCTLHLILKVMLAREWVRSPHGFVLTVICKTVTPINGVQ